MAVMAIEETPMNGQVEGPREKLRQILEKNGEAVLQNPDKVEGLLRDHCGAYRKEISALVGALNERVPVELKSSWHGAMTPEAMRARLVQRMKDDRGLAPELAEWAVDTWSYALGVGLGRSSDRLQNGAGQIPVDFAGNDVAKPRPASSDAERRAAIESDRPGGIAALGAGLLVTAEQKNKARIGAGALFLVAIAAVACINRSHSSQVAIVVAPDAAKQPQKPMQPKPAPAITTAIAAGTPLQIRVNQGFSSDQVTIGENFSGVLAAPLVANGKTVVPAGSNATVEVVRVDQGGRIAGETQMELALVALSANGKRYRVSASDYSVSGPRQAAAVAKRAGKGALIGGGVGVLVGVITKHPVAGVLGGAGGGALIGGATTKPQPAQVRSEQVLSFQLTRPLTA